jgi:hypothetical protein
VHRGSPLHPVTFNEEKLGASCFKTNELRTNTQTHARAYSEVIIGDALTFDFHYPGLTDRLVFANDFPGRGPGKMRTQPRRDRESRKGLAEGGPRNRQIPLCVSAVTSSARKSVEEAQRVRPALGGAPAFVKSLR